MKTELKQSLSSKMTPLILAILCIISGIACGLIGDIILPVLVALLSTLYLFDKSNNRAVSLTASAVLVILNLAGFFMGVCFSVFAPSAIILAYVLSYAFSHKEEKSDTAFLMTVICGLFSVIGYLLLGMSMQGEFTIEASLEFYEMVASTLKESFVSYTLESYNAAGIEISSELLIQMFDLQLKMIIAYILIGAFTVVGFSFKIFSFLVKRCAEDTEEISSWKFSTSSIFAYCYVLLGFASVFVVEYDSLIAVGILNLYYFFMAVYSYVGLKEAYGLLRRKFSSFISVVLLGAGILIFSTLGIQVLAIMGAIFTIRKNSEASLKDN